MPSKTKTKSIRRKARHRRVRGRVFGTPRKPRLYVYKSNRHIYAGLADDVAGVTVLSFSDKKLKVGSNATAEVAHKVGEELAKAAKKQDIKRVVFDRSGYNYHGKVRALAEGARSGGLIF